MDKESLLNKVKIAFFLFLPFLIISLSFFAGKVFAADAIPPPGRIKCNDMNAINPEDPEYASDRPYQASICGDRPVSYWCGNDVVILLANVKVPYCDRRSGEATECDCKGAQCSGDQKIDVSLTDVELPILGNTELTKNSESADDQIDDGTKASNYVAWYLGGTNDKAEYGYSDPETAEGISKIVDTSGPLKKLLPTIIQDAIRLETIKTAATETTYKTDTENEPLTVSQEVSENLNHNQIVVCADKNNEGLFTGLMDLLSLGKYTPTECYTGGGAEAKGDQVLRLLDWGKVLAFNVLANNVISTGLTAIKAAYPFVPAGAIETSIGDHWELARPPLPWSNKNEQPFATDAEYQKAYYEWRGNACAIIPIINKVVCIKNVFVPSLYADMYEYVPLANTVDKKGSHMIANTHIEAPRAELVDVAYQIIHSPQLYLAHSLENYQLTNSLKDTYKPKETAEAGEGGAGVSGTSIPNDVENNSKCRIVPSRTNPGDDSTFGNPESVIEVDVQYTVTTIQCVNIHYVEPVCEEGRCRGGYWDADCSSDIYATVNTVGKFAYNDEIWNNTVAGSDSIFRRIYPKTGAGSPVNCIADTPASSNATYTLYPTQGEELLRIVEPDKSGVKSEDGIVANAQLYYPHYGGVLDYFLNGIQQALLPLGMGPGQPTDGQYCSNVDCGELPELPKAEGSCNLGGTAGINIPQSFKEIVSAAAETYKVPPNLILAVMYGEGAFNTPPRYNWTEENVKNWASCVPLPNCSPGGDVINSVVPFFGIYWENLAQQILPDLQKIDPNKTHADPCNLLDATFALAKDLHSGAGGSTELTGKKCLGITMSSTVPGSCSWNDSQLETAIRVWEFGTAWGSTSNGFLTCATKNNSCFEGGGVNAQCPTDNISQTDTCDIGVGANSHNACVFARSK